MNRTGMASAMDRTREAVAGGEFLPPSSEGSKEKLSSLCELAIQEAEPIGSIPEPLKRGLEGKEAFLDKLGERLAFERSGTRLWEGFLTKFRAHPEQRGGIDGRELEVIHLEELGHFLLLKKAAEDLGADPTAVTPSADVSSVASMGLVQVMTDPRTSLDQCLQALLAAELMDNDGWRMLIALADELGYSDLSEQFQKACETENTHLDKVRQWMMEANLRAVQT